MNIDNFAERVRWWCDYGNLGYDQAQRNNFYIGGEVDCSSLIILTLNECGFNTANATYTGNMRDELTKAGFNAYIYSPGMTLDKGDILLTEDLGHTAVYVGSGLISHARIDERGMIFGGQTGDQTGRETLTQPFYNHPWQFVLRYAGEKTDGKPTAELEEKKLTERDTMFILTRIGDDQHYLVNGLSMLEIDNERLDSLLRIGIKHVHAYPKDVYALMDLTHEGVHDTDKTAMRYRQATLDI